MNRVLCSAPGWTEPLCLSFFRPWHTGFPVRSWSEAGSGRVSRSADAAQSSFSTADPLVLFYTATHQVVLLLHPQQDTCHTEPLDRESAKDKRKRQERGQRQGTKLGMMPKQCRLPLFKSLIRQEKLFTSCGLALLKSLPKSDTAGQQSKLLSMKSSFDRQGRVKQPVLILKSGKKE